MKNIIKVHNTENYNTGEIIYTLCKGKLISLGSLLKHYDTYIISETEEITIDDIGSKVYDKDFNRFVTVDLNLLRNIKSHPYYKVLAFPEELPDSFYLDMDELYEKGVYLECYRRGINSEGVDADLTGGVIIHIKDYWCVRLNKQGKVNIINKKSGWDVAIDRFINENNQNIIGNRKLFNDLVEFFSKNYTEPVSIK